MTDGLTIRPARPDDGERLWRWRNDPAVRRVSLNSDEIALADHLDWFRRSLENDQREILIAEVDKTPFGMVRFDMDGELATVSILLDAGHRGEGLSVSVLAKAIEAARGSWNRLRAVVKSDNAASLALFASLGFAIASEGETIVLERARRSPT